MYNQVRSSWQDLQKRKKEAKIRFIVVSENQVQDLLHIGKRRIYSVLEMGLYTICDGYVSVLYIYIYVQSNVVSVVCKIGTIDLQLLVVTIQ